MSRIAVVTGASSGMGREFVLQIARFYRSLDEIWVMARRRERMERLAIQSRIPLRIFAGDITRKKVLRTLQDALDKENPDIRMLINSAGFGKSGTVEEIAAADKNIQADMIDLNCRALTGITVMCLPFMKKGSRIINLASAAAFCPQPFFAVYAASKSYVLRFSRALGMEVRSRGIYVTAVCPGPVKTEFFQNSGELKNPLKKLTAADASAVVRKALKDSRAKKDMSVYGAGMKAARISAKLLPHRLVMRLYI